MAGCGQCPEACNCVIVDENGDQYEGAGSPGSPIVIPRNGPEWLGTSPLESITITPGDVNPGDGHAPELEVNWCALQEATEVGSGSMFIISDDPEDCQPRKASTPGEGEFWGRTDTGEAGWVSGALSAAAVPAGTLLPFAGAEASTPSGFLLAYGQLVLQADYPVLYGVVGHVYNGGVDPGGGQFRLPDLRGRSIFGLDNMGGSAAGRLTPATALGGTGGVEDVTLGASQIPSHSHPITDPGHTHTGIAHTHTITDPGHTHDWESGPPAETFNTFGDPGADAAAGGEVVVPSGSATPSGTNSSETTGITINNATAGVNSALTGVTGAAFGGSGSHTNVPPYITMNWIIKT